MQYNPKDWYWIVAGDESRAWSSAARAYVPDYPPDRVTRILNEAEIVEVLEKAYPAGAPLTSAAFQRAVEAHTEAVAASRGYSSAVSLASYVSSTIPQWKAEAEAFVSWRDSVWSYALSQLAAVTQGNRQPPASPEAFVSELPAIEWP